MSHENGTISTSSSVTKSKRKSGRRKPWRTALPVVNWGERSQLVWNLLWLSSYTNWISETDFSARGSIAELGDRLSHERQKMLVYEKCAYVLRFVGKWKFGQHNSDRDGNRMDFCAFTFRSRLVHTFIGKRNITFPRFYSTVFIVLFRIAFMRDPCSGYLSIPGSIRPCVKHFCFRYLGPPSGSAGQIVLSDCSNCRSQLEESCCLYEFRLCSTCLLLPRSLSIGMCFDSRCCFFVRLLLTGSCYGIDYPLHSLWSYPPLH